MYIELRSDKLGIGHCVDAEGTSIIVSPEHVIEILLNETTVRLDLILTWRQSRKRDMLLWMLASICMLLLV